MTSPEKTLLETGLVQVGMFRCPPDHAAFPGGVVRHNLIVFPRTAVRIERETAPPVVADPTVAVLYDPPSSYRRYAVDPRGDFCDFFAISPAVADDLSEAAGVDAAVAFRRGSGRAEPAVYLAQRRIFELAAGEMTADLIAIEEGVLAMVATLLSTTRPDEAATSYRQSTSVRHRRLVEDTAEFIAANFTRPLLLSDVAREVGSSPHHLARTFRRVTGTSIHGRFRELRLKRGLETLRDGATDIGRLAAELGFSSHSHFTRAFTTAFGLNPSTYRDQPSQIRTIVQATLP